MTPVLVTRGSGPIVLASPHAGTFVPDDVLAQLNDNGQKLADTDWHIDRLYDGLIRDVTRVSATFHRYVIDANRDPDGTSLYPGQNTTTLVPMTDFNGADIWKTPPDIEDLRARKRGFHAPYHAALRGELDRVRDLHGFAILFDCHSIAPDIAFLFDGTLPDFNIGTNLGVTCAPEVEATVVAICNAAQPYTSTLNGRFKGGWTTRHYGQPDTGIHAIQMELAQSTYLSHAAQPWAYDPDKANRLRPHLCKILTALTDLSLGGTS